MSSVTQPQRNNSLRLCVHEILTSFSPRAPSKVNLNPKSETVTLNLERWLAATRQPEPERQCIQWYRPVRARLNMLNYFESFKFNHKRSLLTCTTSRRPRSCMLRKSRMTVCCSVLQCVETYVVVCCSALRPRSCMLRRVG